MQAKVVLNTAYNYIFPPGEADAYAERLDSNRYKVTINFPDRNGTRNFPN